MFLEKQLICVCKSRKGEGRNIPITRDFKYQRFVVLAEEPTPVSSGESARPKKPDPTAELGEEIAKEFDADEVLSYTDLWNRIGEVAAAKNRVTKAVELGWSRRRPTAGTRSSAPKPHEGDRQQN